MQQHVTSTRYPVERTDSTTNRKPLLLLFIIITRLLAPGGLEGIFMMSYEIYDKIAVSCFMFHVLFHIVHRTVTCNKRL